MGNLAFVDVNDVADVLEGEEGDAHGEPDDRGVEARGMEEVVGPKGDVVHHLELRGTEVVADSGVVDVGEEIGIFEIAEDGEIDYHACSHEGFAAGAGMGVVHTDAECPSEKGGEDKQEDEEAGGLEIEEETEGEEVAVAEHTAAGIEVAVGLAALTRYDESEEEIDDEEEHPEMNLREEQGVFVVEGEERGEVCEDVGQEISCLGG